MFKLSVITINYNNASGLQKTIESVISQAGTDFEFVVIDGGSTDGSTDIIKRYSDKINYWVSEKDNGIYHAMNKGILKATGEYCLFLNSGDFLVDQTIIDKVFSGNHSEDILYGELVFDSGSKKEQIVKRPEKLDMFHMFHDNIWHPASFIKRELFDRIGFYNEKYKIAADYDFFFNALAIKKVSSVYLPFPISVHDTNGISTLPSNLQKVNAERNLIHHSYLTDDEISYLDNLKKFKSGSLSKWLVKKPGINRLFNGLLNVYSKLRK